MKKIMFFLKQNIVLAAIAGLVLVGGGSILAANSKLSLASIIEATGNLVGATSEKAHVYGEEVANDEGVSIPIETVASSGTEL